MKICIGTSGFSYKDWKGVLYPDDTPQRAWLEFYAGHFECVEINSSFYHLPKPSVLEGWYRRTPKKFTFVLKGSRTVTHLKRLKDSRESVDLFYERVHHLKKKAGAVLWQLPPGLKRDYSLLESFLDLLPAEPRPVIEFRNSSWFDDSIFDLLRRNGVACCVHDMPASACPDIVTSPLLYVRFHGPSGSYGGSYSDEHLRNRAQWIIRSQARAAYVFFNNDIGGHAVRNALTLRSLIEHSGL